MLISEVAALSGLEPKTIRFYERAKLVTPRRHGRMRIYRTPELERLRLIKQLRAFDVPIARIRELLKDQESLSLTGNISSFARDLLAKHLEELQVRYIRIQEHIQELKTMLGKVASDATGSTDSPERDLILSPGMGGAST
ncbi:MAG: MerR family transcriptional regulator [Aestuariivirga sp.]